jgi:hypothetical protein
MPVCEADSWRLQYFERAVCPPDVSILTEDSDAWLGILTCLAVVNAWSLHAGLAGRDLLQTHFWRGRPNGVSPRRACRRRYVPVAKLWARAFAAPADCCYKGPDITSGSVVFHENRWF